MPPIGMAVPHVIWGRIGIRFHLAKDPAKSKANFEAAVAVDATYLDSKVLFAEIYAVRAEDQELFKKLLNEVLAADVNANPALVAENKNAQRVAKQMLEDIDDIFLNSLQNRVSQI